jgi:cytochrome b
MADSLSRSEPAPVGSIAMDEAPAGRDAAAGPALAPQRIWDAPTRLAHWLLVASFAIAWLTAEREAWRLVHVYAGDLLCGVLAFRLVWGVVGTRHARFAGFAYRPRAALGYLARLAAGRAPHYAGHNPAGSWAIYALIALGVLAGASGVATYAEFGGALGAKWLPEIHEAVAEAMLWVVGLHLAGVALGSLAHRENLARTMLTGRKRARADEALGARAGHWGVALLAAIAGATLWGLVRLGGA